MLAVVPLSALLPPAPAGQSRRRRPAWFSGSGRPGYGWNEIAVDGRGNIYLNSICFGFMAGDEPRPGIIALVTPDEGRSVGWPTGSSSPTGWS